MALLCRTGLATPESLFDYDGPWSPDLINLMTPMAEAAELAEKERMIESVSAVFGKDLIQGFFNRAGELKRGIRTRALQARGVEAAPATDDQAAQAAEALKAGFGGLGARTVTKGRAKR